MLRCVVTGQDDKPRGIDFEKMDAAFKRAAYKAVHGTREERSGRFLLVKPRNAASVLREPKRQDAGRRKS